MVRTKGKERAIEVEVSDGSVPEEGPYSSDALETAVSGEEKSDSSVDETTRVPASAVPGQVSQSGLNSDGTPRITHENAGDKKQTELRIKIGECMVHETLECSYDAFVKRYWPPLPEPQILDRVILELIQDGVLVPCKKKKGAYRLKWFQTTPFEARRQYEADLKANRRRPVVNEKTIFEKVSDLGSAIRLALKRAKIRANASRVASCPDTYLDSEIWGANFRIDACTTTVDFKVENGRLILGQGTRLHVTDILVPMEFKISRADSRINGLQIASAVNHIMNDDVRRRFVLAITIEDTQVSLWYFSRSHSMKAASFDFVQNPHRFVSLLVALFRAEDDELGLDPLITICGDPGAKKYVYELPPNATRPEAQFFKTELIVDEYRSNRIAGRTTRVWKAIQVVSAKDPTPVRGAEPVILKDAWINHNADTEEDIQKKLFCDIRTFTGGDWRSSALLKYFTSVQSKEAFASVVKNFEDYFSVIAQGHSGAPNKAVARGASRVKRDFYLNPQAYVAGDPAEQRSSASKRTGSVNPSGSQSASSLVAPSSGPASLKSVGSNDALPYREFAQKRRCFFVYKYTCHRVSDLPTLADALEVLRQAYLVLMLMFCAGWIHRDISHGNVLAFQQDTGTWRVKLSDLEYAKKFPPPEGYEPSSDPKTGTPFFMAYELQADDSLYIKVKPKMAQIEVEEPESETEKPLPGDSDVVVMHNFQHDVESIWWMALWLVTMRTDSRESFELGLNVFQGTLSPSIARQRWFVRGLPADLHGTLPTEAKPLFNHLQTWRGLMIDAYRERSPEDMFDPAAYAYGCASPLRFFPKLKPDELSKVELRDPSWIESTNQPAIEESKPRRVPADSTTRRSARLAEKQGGSSRSTGGANTRSVGSRSATQIHPIPEED